MSVVVAVERCYYTAVAAAEVGVDPRTVYRWLRTDPIFAEAMEVSRRIAADRFESAVLAAASEINVPAVRCAEAVVRRVDANEARRRRREVDAHQAVETPAVPVPDCGAALEWARKPRLEAV